MSGPGEKRGDDEARPAGGALRVRSVGKAVDILALVAQSPDGLPAKDIADRLGLSRQTTYHLVRTLLACGMLARRGGSRLLLGLRGGLLAEGFARHLAPSEHLSPLVRQVAERTAETSYAVGWVENEIVTLVVIAGRSAVRAADIPLGRYAHAHARASGKLLLALADSRTREEYLTGHVQEPRTRYTTVGRIALMAQFEQIRSDGYAVDEQEYSEGVNCLAVPLFVGASTFAIGLAAPAERFTMHRAEFVKAARSVLAESGPDHPVKSPWPESAQPESGETNPRARGGRHDPPLSASIGIRGP